MDFKFHRQMAGLSIDDCAKLFDVSKRTVKKWDSGQSRPPMAVFLCLAWRDRGLSIIGEQWAGFRVSSNAIVSMDGEFIYPHEIRMIRLLYLASGISRTSVYEGMARQADTSILSNTYQQLSLFRE